MIDKIGDLAERLATGVSLSRRGFLAQAGQAALGVAGALGGLLALPEATRAAPQKQNTGYCAIDPNGFLTGVCVTSDCKRHGSRQCVGRAHFAGSLCGFLVGTTAC